MTTQDSSFKSKLADWWSRFYKTLFFGANLILFVLLLASYLGTWVSPESAYYLAIIALGYPFYLILNILFVFFWLYHRERKVYFSLGAIVIGFSHFMNLFALNMGSEPAVQEGDYTFMTYNVRYFNAPFYKKRADLDRERNNILDYIQKQDADVFCGQEFSGKQREDAVYIQKFMQKNWPHTHAKASLSIHSKHPITNRGILNFEGTYNAVLFADIQFPTGKMRVYCMHLQSIRLDAHEKQLKDVTKLNNKKTQNKYKKIGSKLKRAFVMRADQVAQLKKHIDASPHPVVVCGDMNDTPISYAYAQLTQKLKDSFRMRAFGLGTTYAGSLPLLRIDYILSSQKLKIKSHQVLSASFSDHYPVLSRLSF